MNDTAERTALLLQLSPYPIYKQELFPSQEPLGGGENSHFQMGGGVSRDLDLLLRLRFSQRGQGKEVKEGGRGDFLVVVVVEPVAPE